MGEAKRRQELDPTFGKPSYHEEFLAKEKVLNQVIDSLYLRVMRLGGASDYLREQIPLWRQYKTKVETDKYLVELPGLGSFTLLPFGDKSYEFVLVNKEIASIRIWNPDRWDTAISTQTGQFYVDFRSKFLQQKGIPAVKQFIENLDKAFVGLLGRGMGEETPMSELASFNESAQLPSTRLGWERVSRVDLACDFQVLKDFLWEDLPKFVTKARRKEVDPQSQSDREAALKILERLRGEISESPPTQGNKGGANCRILSNDLAVLDSAIRGKGGNTDDEAYVYRVLFGRSPESIYFGRFGSALYCRLYNKLKSLDVQGKGYMRDIWLAKGWNGIDSVWRNEFSLSGDFLRECQLIDGGEVVDLREFDQFLKAIPQIWQYLTHTWLRYTIPDPCDKTKTRWETDPTWQIVQTAFPCPTAIYRQEPQSKPTDEGLKAQLLGIVLSLAAKRAECDDDPDSGESVVFDVLDYVSAGIYREKLIKRRKELGIDDFSDTQFSAYLREQTMSEGGGS